MASPQSYWQDPRSFSFGSMPNSTGNLLSGLDIDGQLMGRDATGGIGNNFQDDMNMIGFWGQQPYMNPFYYLGSYGR